VSAAVVRVVPQKQTVVNPRETCVQVLSPRAWKNPAVLLFRFFNQPSLQFAHKRPFPDVHILILREALREKRPS
jgi:hypothetical protein